MVSAPCDIWNSLKELLDFNFKLSLICVSIFFALMPLIIILFISGASSTVIETIFSFNETLTLLKKLVSYKFFIISLILESLMSWPVAMFENIKIISFVTLSLPSILISFIISLLEIDKEKQLNRITSMKVLINLINKLFLYIVFFNF